MKIVAIIQARMGSRRLPGKSLLNLVGKPALQHVLERVSLSTLIDEIWLATTLKEEDSKIVSLAKKLNLKYYRGKVNDVLDRYYQTAKRAKADVIVRITGDCPLIDYKIIDKVIKFFLDNSPRFDYVSNVIPPTFPDGLDVEVFSRKALAKAWQKAKWFSEREHVTPYITQHAELFKLGNVVSRKDFSQYRLTLDNKEDLEFLKLVARECQKVKRYCGLEEIIKILKDHPDWLEINLRIKRNEGYSKSLREDKIFKR